MLRNFRLVLISTMMMDLQHHHGVWKTLAIFTVVQHVYLRSLMMRASFQSMQVPHSIVASFLVFASLLSLHSIPSQLPFLFLQLCYHRIRLHCNFFSCFFNFNTITFHCITISFLVSATLLPLHSTAFQECFFQEWILSKKNSSSKTIVDYCSCLLELQITSLHYW